MNILVALAAVAGLFVVGVLGGALGLEVIFGIIIPTLALFLFLGGIVAKVLGWSRSAVPFRIDNDPVYAEICIRRLERFRNTGREGWQNGHPFETEIQSFFDSSAATENQDVRVEPQQLLF